MATAYWAKMIEKRAMMRFVIVGEGVLSHKVTSQL